MATQNPIEQEGTIRRRKPNSTGSCLLVVGYSTREELARSSTDDSRRTPCRRVIDGDTPFACRSWFARRSAAPHVQDYAIRLPWRPTTGTSPPT